MLPSLSGSNFEGNSWGQRQSFWADVAKRLILMRITGKKILPFPWRYLWIGGFVLGVFQLSQQYSDYLVNGYEFPFSWYFLIVKIFSTYFGWIVFAPFINRISSGIINGPKKNKAYMLIKVSLASGCLIAAHVILTTLLIDLFQFFKLGYISSWLQANRQAAFVGQAFASFGQYVLFLGAFLAYDYYKKYNLKKEELNKAKLDALLMQLHPHFLFNTLHSISSLIDWDTKAAQKMIVRLGGLLRKILNNEDRHLVSLEEEFRFLEQYLGIEKIRFQDRLNVRFDIAENTLQATVPNLVLQPIVENAIKHGLLNKEKNGSLVISSQRLNDSSEMTFLEIKIEDNGKGFTKSMNKNNRKGIGLDNVKNRLVQHYQSNFDFDINSTLNQGCTVVIRIPFEEYKIN